NHLMQICDESDQPLGGLYAAGTLIGDMFANCYNFRIAGHNYGVCLTLGYVTGKYIAQHE
ncbi:MAG TPA: FAD-binding dehydrogenase, partial [Papillibacter sp.]|nr:FAD-binding dehydrogenase [Papillibacter sp.]